VTDAKPSKPPKPIHWAVLIGVFAAVLVARYFLNQALHNDMVSHSVLVGSLALILIIAGRRWARRNR